MLKRLIVGFAALSLAMLAMIAWPSHAEISGSNTYRIEVDITNQITTVYRRSDRSIVRQMICSTGMNDYTPRGTFRLEKTRETTDRRDWYYITKYRCYVKYATRIKGPILFHSLPYAEKSMDSIDEVALSELGTQASHGCIRLRWQDAMWISNNCPDGTEVTIYNSLARKNRLRQILLEQGYSESCGMNYKQFLYSKTEGDGFTLGLGSSGKAVLALQQSLSEQGYLDGDITGTYDRATIVAIMLYQSESGFTVNGITDKALYQLIVGATADTSDYLPQDTEAPQRLTVKYGNGAVLPAIAEDEINGL